LAAPQAEPAWQVLPGQQPCPALPQLLQALSMQVPKPVPQLGPLARQMSFTQQPELQLSPGQQAWPGPPQVLGCGGAASATTVGAMASALLF
jgi:hypothetical protein